jgi:class 3 adenylate cyclase/tetratricopeptide (TPR) repeat protein
MGSGTPSNSLACAECGAGLASTSRFCSACGSPVSSAPERETRRTVTLLFTDVTGSTAMGEHLDPEAYRALMGRYFEVARSTVERHGGTVEKFVGDAVLAVFGLLKIHEDDALRAVRAACELNDAVTALSDQVAAEIGVRLTIRTGVNTGAVVTGTARAGGSFATGDAVNTAARLEQAAGEGEILLGATTYALVRDAVEVEETEPVRAKGKSEAVPAYRLLHVLDEARGRRRRDDQPLVGRLQESRALDDALTQTTSSRRSHVVTILGPPGIGKSRLVKEFLAGIGDRADVAEGRCLSYGRGITYWPLVQALRSAIGLTGTESDHATKRALEHSLGQCNDRDAIVEPLMPLLGVVGTPAAQELTFWAVRRLVEELATRRPLVLCLDDLHWAEPTLLELLERVREELSDLPLLLLCQARPELVEQRPEWGSGPFDSMTLRLDPLDPAETGAVVAELLRGDPPEGLAERVAAWAGGNPLFVEEIVAHLVERDILKRDVEGGWRVVGELSRTELPPTVSALLASRLSLLSASERDLLGRVSVIGLEFSPAEVALLADDTSLTEQNALLSSLARRDLVRRVRSPQGESWAFKHVLVRDAAYDALAKTLRAELHERFADGLLAGDDAESGTDVVGFVAHHLEQAARYCRELTTRGPRTDALVERAGDALRSAADVAADRGDYVSAVATLNRALDLEPLTSAVRRERLARRCDYHREGFQLEELQQGLGAYEAALDDNAGEIDRAFLRMMQGYASMEAGRDIDPGLVSAWADELVTLGRAAADPMSVVRGLRVATLCSTVMGLWEQAAAGCAEIITLGTRADAREARAMRAAAMFVGDTPLSEFTQVWRDQIAPEFPPARRELNLLFAQAVDAAACGSADAHILLDALVAREADLARGGAISDEPSAWFVDVYAMNRDLDGAIVHSERAAQYLRSSGALGAASTTMLLLVLLRLERGDPSEVLLPLLEEAEGYTSPYDLASVAFGSACRAILALRDGDQDRAVELTDLTLRTADGGQEVWKQADLRRWLSVVPRTRGDRDEERRLLREAAERYARKEICSYDAEIDARLVELEGTGA